MKTGWPFGHYTYGQTLGLEVMDVPLTIGINWFLLTYIFGNLTSTYAPRSEYLRVPLAALLMTGLDMLIEPIAVQSDYWAWHTDLIPVSNYLGWFGVSLVMQFLYGSAKISSSNLLAFYLLFAQLIFFTCQLFIN